MRQWFEATLSKLSRKSETTVAIRYALSRWDALTRYIEDGHIEIDNNAAERSLRGVALGRKNYLFAGSDRGGERAAAMYSLIGSAKLNGLDPEAYLREVLTRIAEQPTFRPQTHSPPNRQCRCQQFRPCGPAAHRRSDRRWRNHRGHTRSRGLCGSGHGWSQHLSDAEASAR